MNIYNQMKLSLLAISIIFVSCAKDNTNISTQNKYYTKYINAKGANVAQILNPNNGKIITHSKNGKIKIIEHADKDAIYAFKDMNHNNKLDTWEDWRKDSYTRAKSLASELSLEQIAGLMLFSSHERNPEKDLTEEQKKYLKNDNLRNVLNAGPNNIENIVIWVNSMQEFIETLDTVYIPVNFSSDPRSTASSDAQYNSEGDDISRWPSNLGIAATFSTKTMLDFATTESEEYRGLGITTALGPQIELATDPRWLRVEGTFGENSALSTDMSQAYIDGSQSTYKNGKDIGWGKNSVNTMIKHFPGDGMGEGGRESHMNTGKYAVYPGNNFSEHLAPFIDAGLNLKGKTKQAASMMVSYSVAINKHGKQLFGTKKGSAYDKDKIDILRNQHNYNGVLCTDWAVTTDVKDKGNTLGLGMAWGMEKETIAARHYEVIVSGIDMFGGNNDIKPVLEAYSIWQANYKKGLLPVSARERFEQSAARILTMIFNTGTFENPYLDISESKNIVGTPDKKLKGYKAQLDSIVMLKNNENTINKNNLNNLKTVYIPSTKRHVFKNIFHPASDYVGSSMNELISNKTFAKVVYDKQTSKGLFVAPNLSNVDMIIVGMQSPDNGDNFSSAGLKNNKFYPLSLRYRPYTATSSFVRRASIAGDTLKNNKYGNRSYFGATSIIGNEYDLDALLNARKEADKNFLATGKKIPVVAVIKAKNPVVPEEFEKYADAIITGFGVSDAAYFDIIKGIQEPNGLLPIGFPKNMQAVENSFEDVGEDVESYIDSNGNSYKFGFGLNYSGVINDARTKKYVK